MSRLAATLFAACVTLTATLTAGCAENQETLIVLHSAGFDENCVVSAEDTFPAYGQLDVLYETPYVMGAALLNNAPSQSADDNNTGIVTNEIKLLRAEVKLDSPTVPDLFDGMDRNQYEFSAPLQTISLAPQSQSSIAVEVVPTVTSQNLSDIILTYPPMTRIMIRANVVFVGSRTGNDVGKVGEVKSRDFSFPIEICAGCLLDCSSCPDGVCSADLLAGGVTGNGCGNAQDGPVVPTACAAE